MGEEYIWPSFDLNQKQPLADILRNFSIFTGKGICRSLFFIKYTNLRHLILLNRVSDIGTFLWLLGNFKNTYLYRTYPVASSIERYSQLAFTCLKSTVETPEQCVKSIERWFPAGIYLFKFNSGNPRTMCEVYSKLTHKDTKTTSMMLFWYLFC